MVPGTVALVTDAIGFLTILFVPIGVIHELAITASIGVACIIVANILVLTLILSFFPNLMPPEAEEAETVTASIVKRLLDAVSRLTHGTRAYWVTGIAVVLLLIGLFSSRTMTVGDVNPGEPLLWEDSVYNRDAAKMMLDYMFGIDWLSVVVTGDEMGVCKEYDTMMTMEEYESVIGNIPGVTVAVSSLLIGKMINETFHEGDIRWRVLPQTSRELGFMFGYAGSNEDTIFNTMHCQSMNIMVYLTDHKGDTIRRVMEASKKFIADHPLSGSARFVLAGGNAGVMAATNEVVGEAQVPMLLLIYLSIFVLCLLVFRNLKAPLFIVAPLFLVSVIATAFMKVVGLGLNVNTLPVAALGVGIGVDYGIYFYSRLTEERKKQDSFADAASVTLQTTGAAVLYTALTLSAGVFTWLLSDLKFQADMGLLLGFIFLANMVGAMVLLPALIYIFDVKDKTGNKTEDR
jgi:predicted RND superfamily exporter protein